MSKLTAQALTKSYGKKEVLHNIDLTLESGKIYGLIGRNGAGKTTLLSILTDSSESCHSRNYHPGRTAGMGEPGSAQTALLFQRTDCI